MPYRKLGRTSSHRWAMLRNMVTSLVEHERIRTTTAKVIIMTKVSSCKNARNLKRDVSLSTERRLAQ